MKTKKSKTTEPNPTSAETAAAPNPRDAGATLGEFKRLPRNRIRPDPNQPRKIFSEPELDEMAVSICLEGIIQPLLVRHVKGLRIEAPDIARKTWEAIDAKGAVVFEGGEEEVKGFAEGKTEDFWQIIAGERRWRGSEGRRIEVNGAKIDWPGLSELPCIVTEADERRVFALQHIENQKRVNLSALEEAESFARELERRRQADPGFSAEKLGDELGMKRGTAYNRLKLTRLHGPVRLALENGLIEPVVAMEISLIPGRDTQEEFLGILKENLDAGQPFSARDVREYIQNNYVKQLNGDIFDLKEEGYFPAGIDPKDYGVIFTGPCTKCPMRSGNMKEMFPEIKSLNVCTSPTCFVEKAKAEQARKVDELQKDGNEVISRDEYFKRQDEFVRVEGQPVNAGKRWLEVKQIVGKKKLKTTYVQSGSTFEALYRKEDVIAAGKENGLDMEPPKPKPQPKASKPDRGAEPEQDPVTANEKFSEEDKKKWIEQQRKNEEKRERELRKQEARKKLVEDTAKAAWTEMQRVIEKQPVNAKGETEFWKLMFAQGQFRDAMIFYNGHQDLLDRRGVKATLPKFLEGLSYQEIRAVMVEQLLFDDGGAYHESDYGTQFKEFCKFFGVDLKKLEREVESRNGELAGMPEPKAKQKKKGKKS